MEKGNKLSRIAEDIKICPICKKDSSGKPVPGEGSPNAKIVFIGEAPGRQEAKAGRPFVGRSGQVLRSQILDIGLEEENVYITSPVKYLPDRGTPSTKQIVHGKVHLLSQLEIIQPKLIVLLGSVATQGVLDRKIPVQKEHGTSFKEDSITYFITFHPAAALRFPQTRELFKKDFQKLKRLLSSIL